MGIARTLTIAAIATATMAGSAHAANAATVIDQAERAQITKINAYRASHGLKALRIDLKLTRAAEWMSHDMSQKNRFSHTDSLGRSPFRRIALQKYPSDTWRGENLAAGNEDPTATFEQWRNSPAHNANMLKPNYRAIGIARVYSATATYGWYWTTTFGSRLTS